VSLDPYGLGRVIEPLGVLPQQARRLDPSLPLREDELLIAVEALNVDAASFRQLRQAVGDDTHALAQLVTEIVRERGKLQNPVTGSGGMLLGSVREIGPAHPAKATLRIGDRIATLVSLTLTPLHLDEVKSVDLRRDRVEVSGHAILFASGPFAKLSIDLPEPLALAALDVCGAPALTERYVRPGHRVLLLGAGKSGALCAAQAKRSGATQILACDIDPAVAGELERLGYAQALVADATNALLVADAVDRATGGALCDLVINVANVPGTEMASLLSVRPGGTVIFFSMATSFTAAALGAEGIGKDAILLIGNGFVPWHAELTLGLLRSEPPLRRLLESRFLR
jgi:L-erythro-3,5-diaminohexanoate dehydrogenase